MPLSLDTEGSTSNPAAVGPGLLQHEAGLLVRDEELLHLAIGNGFKLFVLWIGVECWA